ncbi:MAG TPA: HD domain-containing phosphohydrolase [Chloroflexia bacterium]|nr:HD domain-containing phosphohydrolase [Chloroflexia bacterium]
MVEALRDLRSESAGTWRHLGRVARHAIAFGKGLGLDLDGLMTLHCGAMLHDVGKQLVPSEILDKASPLDPDEWYAVTKHSMLSAQILKARAIHRSVALLAQSHHEWYNGRGYPLGLEGESIPLAARVLSIADACEAMSNDRPYRPALSPEAVLNELDRGSGTQFDPTLVRRLRPLLEAGMETLVPTRTLRVVSDDPALHRALWFAAYPWGWETVPWPAAWTAGCPAELVCEPEQSLSVGLTIVDGQCLPRLPDGALNSIEGPILWVDAPEGRTPGVTRPLDLCHLLSFLDQDTAWNVNDAAHGDPVKVLVADPFKLFRQALVRCFEDREDVQVVGAVDSPDAYRRALETAAFDVAVVASDFLEGTRTVRELRPGDSLLAGQAEGHASREHADVPLVVLLADEDLEDLARSVGTQVPPVWVPGRFVEGKRVSIPRGAPVEWLVEAISLLAEKKAGTQPPGQNGPFFGGPQPQTWSC